MAKLKGTLRYNAKETSLAFFSMSTEYLLTSEDRLGDSEIVIYALILIKGYLHDKTYSKYTEGITSLAAMSTMSWHSVDRALGGLITKGMLRKKGKNYISTTPKQSSKHLMVSSAMLMSKKLTVPQKAFILRLAAIKESVPGDVLINNSEIAVILDVHRSTVVNTLSTMEKSGIWHKQWITTENEQLVVDFDILQELVSDELNDELLHYREEEVKNISFKDIISDDPDNLWLKVHGKTSNKKRRLINDLETLRVRGVITISKANKLLEYIRQSRLSYVQQFIDNI
ncbi:MAG: hypothetical protein KAH32_05965 [Chlamydiia bacterium]|nr:hypothetical protein [Chlamydiia bacterium]